MLNVNILKFMRKIFALFVLVSGFISCEKDKELKVDVSKIEVDLKLHRFDVDFYTANPKDLNSLKHKYPVLFPEQPDSVWFQKMNDKDEVDLYKETQKVYKNIESLKTELTSLFKHVKYYNKRFTSPRVITMLTNIDYDNRVVYADSLLLISLDAYLGENHQFYNDYPAYVKENNKKEHIIVDVAKSLINAQIINIKPRRFVDKMIHRGKKMYLLDAYLPNVLDKEKIGYLPRKFDWAKTNEEQIWKYFIENEILYSTNREFDKRFLDIAPFSKFYMEQDRQSPGRIGEFIGWQIVRSYMQKNDVSLQELLQKNEEEIFKNSKYKPKK